jgi:hypothetical protein
MKEFDAAAQPFAEIMPNNKDQKIEKTVAQHIVAH